MVEAIRTHVFAAERIHADDTTVLVQAKGKCRTGRLWTYVRDDRPFGGPAAPAAALFYSPNRGGQHPEQHLASYVGLMQADAYAGFNRLYEATRKPGPIVEAACWAHAPSKPGVPPAILPLARFALVAWARPPRLPSTVSVGFINGNSKRGFIDLRKPRLGTRHLIQSARILGYVADPVTSSRSSG